MSQVKFDWNDITIVPATISDIDSRKEVSPTLKVENGINMLPLFTAPMDTVIGSDNANQFYEKGINICLPRGINFTGSNTHLFYAYGLDEIIEIVEAGKLLPKKVLIDIANGHMKKLFDIASRIKKEYDVELMVGNIANPETYREFCKIGVDWVRCGIGGGSACTTSANVAIHYPMASLIFECGVISKEFTNPTKIIADGGFRNFSDIIKAIGLGADAVMIGGILNKCLESVSDSYTKVGEQYIKIGSEDALNRFSLGEDIYKYYRGMSTKEVQKTWKKDDLKTAEGITKYNRVEYSLNSWVENFTDYLKSNMSYCGFRTIEEFKGNANFVQITTQAYNRFNK
jgi:IMP dehydrogenase